MSITVLLISLLIWGCQTENPRKKLTPLPYKLDQPVAKYKLSNKLQEISALSWAGPGKLYCVDDEAGVLFTYDLKKQEISEKRKFWKDGDFEGVEKVGNDIWVLKSNGRLYQIREGKKEAVEYKTFLTKSADTEGLAYDRTRLLIACKGVPIANTLSSDHQTTSQKVIYAFDLEQKKLLRKPAYSIKLDDLKMFKLMNPLVKGIEGIQEFFSPGSNLSFQPSGIAVHPNSGDLYIISSVGKLLVVLDINGNIQHIESLDPSIFKQPEGIAFSGDGKKLYISNEGRGGAANILEFDFHGQ